MELSSAILESIKKSYFSTLKNNDGNIEVTVLCGDGSTRSYYRICKGEDLYICCVYPEDQKESLANYVDAQRALSSRQVLVPDLYYVDKSLNYSIQEDLGDKSLLACLAENTKIKDEFEFYKNLLDQLFLIQKIPLQELKEGPFSTLSFDVEKLMFEVNFTIKHYIEGFLGYQLSQKERETIVNVFTNIASSIQDHKQVLVHRDFHSRNIMMKDNGQLVIIDFQDMRRGSLYYDAVSLLDDSYYQINLENVDKLKKYFWENEKVGSYEDFLKQYDQMAVQRLFKAIGSFAYINSIKNNKKFLTHIGFAFEKLKHRLMKYEEYSELVRTLSVIHYGH
jgi:N-acetylmuramate 1-kinase